MVQEQASMNQQRHEQQPLYGHVFYGNSFRLPTLSLNQVVQDFCCTPAKLILEL